jgi:hypothetical protein
MSGGWNSLRIVSVAVRAGEFRYRTVAISSSTETVHMLQM